VRVLVARTWVVSVETQEFILRLPHDDLFRSIYLPPTVVTALCDVLFWEATTWSSSNLAEFLDGVGGYSQFAHVLVNHIDSFLAGPKELSALHFLYSILTFLKEADHTHEMSRSSPHAVVVGLTRALCILADAKLDGAIEVMHTCVALLQGTFIAAPLAGYERIVVALEAGFMRGVASYVCREELRGDPLHNMSLLFKKILISGAVHHGVLLSLGPALMASEV